MSDTRSLQRGRLQSLGIGGDASLADRPLPSNLRAEQSLLGAMMVNNKAFGTVADFLIPAHFSDPMHGRIYAEMARRIISGQKADAVVLANWFRADPQAAEVGGTAYLADLVTSMVSIMTVADYGAEIKSCWVRREAINAARALMDEAFSQTGDIESGLNDLNRAVDLALSGSQKEASTFDEAMGDALAMVDEAIASKGKNGLNIGQDFPRTKATVRLTAKRLILVGGDTGAGKSALVWGWTINAARDMLDRIEIGTPISEVGGIIGLSMEMDAASIALRAACSYASVPYDRAEAGVITPYEREQLEDARTALGKLPIVFIAVGGMTPGMIKLRARQAQRRFGGKLAGIIIDHLQLMDADGEAARAGGAWAMKSIINTLIGFPKTFDCPVIALSQLRPDVMERQNKRPHAGDYAWGKALGQAADFAMFIYREEYYLRRKRPYQEPGESPHTYQDRLDQWQAALDAVVGKAELIIAKARGGAERTVMLLFNGPTMTFTEDPGQ